MKDSKTRLLIYLLLILIPLAVYWQCTSYEFVWDDKDPNLTENRYLHNTSFKNVLHFWTKPYAQMYIPIPYTAWALIKEIGAFLPWGQKVVGFNPFTFHLSSILFHIFNGLLVFGILKLLIKNEWSAFFGTLIFLLHPLQVESVVWITEFRGLLAAFFGFSSLYLIIKNEFLKKKNISKSYLRIRYINSLILFVFGMLSKPSVVVIPAFAFLIYFLYFKKRFWQSFKKIIPFIIVTIPFIIILRFIQPASYNAEVAPLWSRFFIWMDTINFYIFKTLIPYPLVATYTRTFQTLLPKFWLYLEWVIPILLVFLAVKFYKKNPFILLSLLIFIVGFLPVSGLISFVFQNWSNVADRYMYFSMFGIAIIFSFIICKYPSRKIIIASSSLVIVLTLLTALIQIPVWKDPISLWSHAIKYGKPNTFVYNNRGVAYNKHKRFDEAIRDLDKALEFNPNNTDAFNNRGNALKGNGEFGSALEDYKKSLSFNSSQPKSYYNIGLVYAESDNPDSAIVYYNKAISQLPNYTSAYLNRGIAYAGMKQFDKALENYDLVIKIDPSDEMAYSNRGILYFDTGNFSQAEYDFLKAIELNPQRAQTYYLRGKVNFVEKNYVAALEDYNNALLLDDTFVDVYIKRALLYTEMGNFERAIDDINTANSLSENDIEILITKGDILSKEKLFSESAQAYTDAINIEPDYGILYQKRAVSYYFLGKYDKARGDIQKAKNFGITIPKSFLNALGNK